MSDPLSQSTCLEMLHPKTDEHVNPRVEVQRKVPTCPGKHLFVIRERLYAHPLYVHVVWDRYRGADKSLARPRRQQANVSVRMS